MPASSPNPPATRAGKGLSKLARFLLLTQILVGGNSVWATVPPPDACEVLRPNQNVNTLWSNYDYTNIDDNLTYPDTPGGYDEILADDGNDFDVQIYGFGNPAASNYSTVTKVYVFVYGYQYNVPAPVLRVRIRIGSGGAWSSPITVALGTSNGWHQALFFGSWTIAQINDLQVGLEAGDTYGDTGEIHIGVLYCNVCGPEFTPTPTYTFTPTPTYTPTPTFTPRSINVAVWQDFSGGMGHPTHDVDAIALETPVWVHWKESSETPLPRKIYRSTDRVNWTQITPIPTWVPNGPKDGPDGTNYPFYVFIEKHTAVGHYWYQIRDLSGNVLYDDAGDGPALWEGGIAVVTPCPTHSPTPTPSGKNLVKNPKFSFRYDILAGDKDMNPTPTPYPRDIARYWEPFLWPPGCNLPPSGSDTGLGAAMSTVDWKQNSSDAPSGVSVWSQEISGDGAFCAGIYQQVRVSPGFKYRVCAWGRISGGNDNSSMGIACGLDGSTDPARAELVDWDEKTSSVEPGNWGDRGSIGTSWIDRQYLGMDDVIPVADTLTVFLFGQTSGGQSTSFLFNDVLVELKPSQSPTPTPAPRCIYPVFNVEVGGNILLAVGCWGDLTANGLAENEPLPLPTEIDSMPWKTYNDHDAAWVDPDGVLHTTGQLRPLASSCRPAPSSFWHKRGGRGPEPDVGAVVFGIDANAEVYCRDFYVRDEDDDGDTLSNYEEIFYYATDPTLWDTDGDEVSDHTELLGATVDSTPLPLDDWGADPLHKDLWMELDWMATPTQVDRPSMAPRATPLAMVAEMFDSAPVENPDGISGITLHIDAGNNSNLSQNFVAAANEYRGGEIKPYQAVSSLQSTISNTNGAGPWVEGSCHRRHVFRYGMFAYEHPEGSRINGEGFFPVGDKFSAFIITLERFPSSNEKQSAAIVHEFGHNLGLNHSGIPQFGYEFPISRYWSLAYNSIMNYQFSTGVDTNCNVGKLEDDGALYNYHPDPDQPFKLDYSSGERIDLVENSLHEALGVCGFGFPVDWDHNGCIDSGTVARNLDGNPNRSHLIRDFDDWGNLNYVASGSGFGPPIGADDFTCTIESPAPSEASCACELFFVPTEP